MESYTIVRFLMCWEEGVSVWQTHCQKKLFFYICALF